MIKSLTLRNWRSYEEATISFGPGTTFVVASNGIGKTSLVEAVRWALFGKIARDGHAAVRAGAGSATAAVELELPDGRVLSVERRLENKPRRIPPEPLVRLDGEMLTADALYRHLGDAYRTEPAFLASLTMPGVERGQGSPAKLGLAEHLGRYYGIDSLQVAAAQLDALLRETQGSIKRTKAGNAASAKQLEELRGAVDRATHQVSVATTQHEKIQVRLERARERERYESALRKWEVERDQWTEAAAVLASRVQQETGDATSIEGFDDALEQRLVTLGQRLEVVHVELAVNQSKHTALSGNDERLSSAHDDCPVCRRPLDESTVETAHQANLQEIELIRNEIKQLSAEEDRLSAQRQRMTTLRAEWRELARPSNRPSPMEGEPEPTASALLAEQARETLTLVVEARTVQARAKEELASAEGAEEAMRQLINLFQREATLTVAVTTTKATLDGLLAETVEPLASELDQRWKALFPGRGDLSTATSGDITRSIGDHPLPFESFSTGESMGAMILIRLLAAQMATKADFCWFDEPLEHLDPDVRRHVANVLSRATKGEGQLRQVVVTTYEEQLASQLQARDEQRVHLIDVRQAT